MAVRTEPPAALALLDDVPVGGALAATAPDGAPLLLVRSAPTAVRGFSAVCPHLGYRVAPAGDELVCPYHGSRFDLSGTVVRGPALRDLTPYAVAVVGGSVVPAG